MQRLETSAICVLLPLQTTPTRTMHAYESIVAVHCTMLASFIQGALLSCGKCWWMTRIAPSRRQGTDVQGRKGESDLRAPVRAKAIFGRRCAGAPHSTPPPTYPWGNWSVLARHSMGGRHVHV